MKARTYKEYLFLDDKEGKDGKDSDSKDSKSKDKKADKKDKKDSKDKKKEEKKKEPKKPKIEQDILVNKGDGKCTEEKQHTSTVARFLSTSLTTCFAAHLVMDVFAHLTNKLVLEEEEVWSWVCISSMGALE